MTVSETPWATELLRATPWMLLAAGGMLVVGVLVAASLAHWLGTRSGVSRDRDAQADHCRCRVLVEMCHTLQAIHTTLSLLEHHMVAIERYVAHEQETWALLLERLPSRTRTSRKTPSSRVRGDEE